MSSDSDTATDSDVSDDYDDDRPFSVNAIISVQGTYSSSWHDSASGLWSSHLLERGDFRATDALLLAFTVDVGMKLYVVNGLVDPVLHMSDDSALVWTILDRVHNSLCAQVGLCGWSQGDIMRSVEYFFLATATGFDRIRERFEIAFLQNIQDPGFQQMFARELVVHHSFANENTTLRKVFRWVYGEWPQSVLTQNTNDAEGALRQPITIQQWVFNQN